MAKDITLAEPETASRSEREAGEAVASATRAIETYIARCKARIPSFIDGNFTLAATWQLQRRTLWLDLLCAPLNSAWALPHLALQKGAESLARVGYAGPARWSRHVPAGIKTGYQRNIERLICLDLLEWDPESAAGLPQGFLCELDEVSALRIERAQRDEPGRSVRDLLQQFSSGRAIVSDLAGTLLTLALSWWCFGSASQGLKGIAQGVAQQRAHDRAASRFFLGKKAGNHFYNVFPPAASDASVYTVLGLLIVGLSVAAMACTILSDPLRRKLGLHRNRLEALVDDVERELIVLTHKALRTPRPSGEARGPN